MKKIVFTEPARMDVRRLDIPTAMRIFAALHRFAETGIGDAKKLLGEENFRLRIGDYRIIFTQGSDRIHVKRVAHRSEAYR